MSNSSQRGDTQNQNHVNTQTVSSTPEMQNVVASTSNVQKQVSGSIDIKEVLTKSEYFKRFYAIEKGKMRGAKSAAYNLALLEIKRLAVVFCKSRNYAFLSIWGESKDNYDMLWIKIDKFYDWAGVLHKGDSSHPNSPYGVFDDEVWSLQFSQNGYLKTIGLENSKNDNGQKRLLFALIKSNTEVAFLATNTIFTTNTCSTWARPWTRSAGRSIASCSARKTSASRGPSTSGFTGKRICRTSIDRRWKP